VKHFSIGLFLAAAVFAQAPAPAPAADPAVLTVGEEKLTRADWENLMLALPEGARAQASSPEGKRRLAEQLGELKAIAQEARKQQFHNTPKTKAILQVQSDQALASAYMQHLSESAPNGDAALREMYEKEKNQHKQVDARHVLIRFQGSPVPVRPNQKDLTDAEALAKAETVRKRLVAGEDFATVAKAESDDSGSGAAGGELGTFGPGQMVRPFEEAAFNLAPGKLSELIKTQFGYHIIQVKSQTTKSFEEMKPMLEQRRKPEFARKTAEGIKSRAAIKLDEAFFGKPATAVLPAPPAGSK